MVADVHLRIDGEAIAERFRALEDFDKAIELKADFADAYRNRGVLYTNRGQMALGVPDLRRALELYEEKDDEERAADVRRLLSGVFP